MENKMFQTEIDQFKVDISYSVWSMQSMKWQAKVENAFSVVELRGHSLGHF